MDNQAARKVPIIEKMLVGRFTNKQAAQLLTSVSDKYSGWNRGIFEWSHEYFYTPAPATYYPRPGKY